MPVLNRCLIPDIETAVGELHAAGVSGTTVTALYGFDIDAYRAGITALRSDPKRRAQLNRALKAAPLSWLWAVVRALPDPEGVLPQADIPGRNTPLGDKRVLRLFAATLHGLSVYDFDLLAASVQQHAQWERKQLARVVPRLEKLLAELEAISDGTLREPWRRPAPTPRQRRRHARNYPRRAGSRFRRR